MGRRRIAIACLAALLGVWIWANLRPDPGAPPVAAPAAVRTPAIGTPEVALGSDPAATESPRVEAVREPADEPDASRSATRSAVGAGPALPIEVVDLDGRPVPGASIWVHEIPVDGRRALLPKLDEVLSRLQLEVEPRIADDDGRATLVWPPAAFQVVAANDELAGSLWTSGAEDRDGAGRRGAETRRSPLRVVLGPRGGWRARVVRSGSGLPVAGILVSTHFHFRHEDGSPEALWSWDGEARRTDPNGIAAVGGLART